MKTTQVIGAVLILIGVLLGIYVGIWVCFIGGIIDVIQSIRAEHFETAVVAWGIAKVVFASFFGWLSAILLIIPGYVMVQD